MENKFLIAYGFSLIVLLSTCQRINCTDLDKQQKNPNISQDRSHLTRLFASFFSKHLSIVVVVDVVSLSIFQQD